MQNPHHLPFSNCKDAEEQYSDFNVVIEAQQGTNVKYEMDKDTGLLHVDRILPSSVQFPVDYGFAPGTLCKDGDALDILVYMPGCTLQPGSVIRCRAIGVMYMTDESGEDNKVIAVPISSVSQQYDDVHDVHDLPDIVLQEITLFFRTYKKLAPKKWAKVEEVWGNWLDATDEIENSLALFQRVNQKKKKKRALSEDAEGVSGRTRSHSSKRQKQ